MGEPSVFIKVALYLFDLVSDWVNGGLMLHKVDTIDTGNTSIPNSTNDRCLNETGGPHIAWGTMTIGMSWVPAVFAIGIIQSQGVSYVAMKKKWIPVKFIFWPILVPIHMLSCAGYLPWSVAKWIADDKDYAVSMVLKAMEGIVEAAPQLTLQLFIITRTGLKLLPIEINDAMKLVSMVMSTITVHMASVDMSNYLVSIDWQIDTLSLKEAGLLYLRRAAFNIPSTLFKTGTLALMFSTLKYGGAVHVTILALTYYCVMKLTSTEFSVTLAGMNIFTTTLGVQYRKVSETTYITQTTTCTQICTWLGYTINVTGLLACYILTEYTEVTFHCETHDWLRPRGNLQIACWSLAGLGLLSCFATEGHLRTNPMDKIGRLRRQQQPENENENIEMIANP